MTFNALYTASTSNIYIFFLFLLLQQLIQKNIVKVLNKHMKTVKTSISNIFIIIHDLS